MKHWFVATPPWYLRLFERRKVSSFQCGGSMCGVCQFLYLFDLTDALTIITEESLEEGRI